MEITEQMAIDLGVAAGDHSMKTAGREIWNEDDRAVADAVYERFKPAITPVQKMDDEVSENGPAT
jgi:hypothetical protein